MPARQATGKLRGRPGDRGRSAVTVDVGCRQPRLGTGDYEPEPPPQGERFDNFTSTAADGRGCRAQKERYITSQPSAQGLQVGDGQAQVPQAIEAPQSGGRIAGSTGEARRQRNSFDKLDARAALRAGKFAQELCRAQHEVVGTVSGELAATSAAGTAIEARQVHRA